MTFFAPCQGKISRQKAYLGVGKPKTGFSEPRFSEILDLMNKLHLTFSYFLFTPTLFSE